MSKRLWVLFLGVLLQACGSAPESTDVAQEELGAIRGAPGALACCRDRFRDPRRRGLCMAEAARGEGPCATRHHPGTGGAPGCKDAGTGTDAAGDAGTDAANDAGADAAKDAGNLCPSLVTVSAVPEAAPAAAKFDLSAVVADNGAPDTISFDWRVLDASAGWVDGSQSTPSATYVCGALGSQTLELTMTGGDPTAICTTSATLSVECTTLCGNGVIDPGETCDPPDGVNCDVTCNGVNHCPVLTVPFSISLNVGDTTTLTVAASDPDPTDTLSYTWNPLAGVVSGDTSGPSVTYSCTVAVPTSINVTVSDGKCSTTKFIYAYCFPKCGNGIVESGEMCDPPRTGPDGLQCGPTCQYLTCGNGKIDPGEQCDPPQTGLCSSTCQTIACGNGVLDPGEQCEPPRGGVCSSTCQLISSQPACGDGVLEPGEGCDPPNGTTCDQTCQPISTVCGDGIQEPGEGCDLGPTTPALCRNCQLTNCGGCFASASGSGPICGGLNPADTQACNALLTCTTNNMGSCAQVTGAACYCSGAALVPPSNCSDGVYGPCVAQFQALAHSNDPAAVLAQINDTSTPVGRVAAAVHKFATTEFCGPACYVYNN
jgi:hypothetical protein